MRPLLAIVLVLICSPVSGEEIPPFSDTMQSAELPGHLIIGLLEEIERLRATIAELTAEPNEPTSVEPLPPIKPPTPARRRVWVRTGMFRGHWEWR